MAAAAAAARLLLIFSLGALLLLLPEKVDAVDRRRAQGNRGNMARDRSSRWNRDMGRRRLPTGDPSSDPHNFHGSHTLVRNDSIMQARLSHNYSSQVSVQGSLVASQASIVPGANLGVPSAAAIVDPSTVLDDQLYHLSFAVDLHDFQTGFRTQHPYLTTSDSNNPGNFEISITLYNDFLIDMPPPVRFKILIRTCNGVNIAVHDVTSDTGTIQSVGNPDDLVFETTQNLASSFLSVFGSDTLYLRLTTTGWGMLTVDSIMVTEPLSLVDGTLISAARYSDYGFFRDSDYFDSIDTYGVLDATQTMFPLVCIYPTYFFDSITIGYANQEDDFDIVVFFFNPFYPTPPANFEFDVTATAIAGNIQILRWEDRQDPNNFVAGNILTADATLFPDLLEIQQANLDWRQFYWRVVTQDLGTITVGASSTTTPGFTANTVTLIMGLRPVVTLSSLSPYFRHRRQLQSNLVPASSTYALTYQVTNPNTNFAITNFDLWIRQLPGSTSTLDNVALGPNPPPGVVYTGPASASTGILFAIVGGALAPGATISIPILLTVGAVGDLQVRFQFQGYTGTGVHTLDQETFLNITVVSDNELTRYNATAEIQQATERIITNTTIETKAAAEDVKQNVTQEIQEAEGRIGNNITQAIQSAQSNILNVTTLETKAAAEDVKANLTKQIQDAESRITQNVSIAIQNATSTILQNTTTEIKAAAASVVNATTTNLTQEIKAAEGRIVQNVTAALQNATSTILQNTTTEIKSAATALVTATTTNLTQEVKAAEGRIIQNTTIEIQKAQTSILANTTTEIKSATTAAAQSVLTNLTQEVKAAEGRVVQNTTATIQNAANAILTNTSSETKAATEGVKVNLTHEIKAAEGRITQNATTQIQNAQSTILTNTTAETKAAAEAVKTNLTEEIKLAEGRIEQNATIELQNIQTVILANTTAEMQGVAPRVVQNLTAGITEAKNAIATNTTIQIQELGGRLNATISDGLASLATSVGQSANWLENTTAEIRASEARIQQNTTIEVQQAAGNTQQNSTIEIAKAVTSITSNFTSQTNAIKPILSAINDTVNTKLVCLAPNSTAFIKTPGLGCNALDDDCTNGVDDCGEDHHKPTFKNPNCQASLANTWVTSTADAAKVLCNTAKPEDDCTTENELVVNTTLKSGTCESALWTVKATDKCGNQREIDLNLPYYPAGTTPLTVNFTTTPSMFTTKSLILQPVKINLNTTNACPGSKLNMKLTVWSDEGYAPTYINENWRSTFARAVEQRGFDGTLTGYDIFLLPFPFKKPCDLKNKIICSPQSPLTGWSRYYYIDIEVSNAAGLVAKASRTVPVIIKLGRRRLVDGLTSMLAKGGRSDDSSSDDIRALHSGIDEVDGRKFKLLEVQGVLGGQ